MLIKKASSALILLLIAGSLQAAEINVLSAGAVEPGLHAAAEAFRKISGDDVKVRFATAPALLQRVGGGERADVLIAPPAVIEQLGKAGKVDAKSGISIGRVGVGVAVRQGAPIPDVSSVDALKRALLEAESVVYNHASTGNYVHGLLERLGVADQLAKKTTR
jgi:molybdate transport system substrate-binding protein